MKKEYNVHTILIYTTEIYFGLYVNRISFLLAHVQNIYSIWVLRVHISFLDWDPTALEWGPIDA